MVIKEEKMQGEEGADRRGSGAPPANAGSSQSELSSRCSHCSALWRHNDLTPAAACASPLFSTFVEQPKVPAAPARTARSAQTANPTLTLVLATFERRA